MNKTSIGFSAGIVWRLMDNRQTWTYAELKERSGLTDSELWAAIGWLAREDKLFIEEDVRTGEERFVQPYSSYF